MPLNYEVRWGQSYVVIKKQARNNNNKKTLTRNGSTAYINKINLIGENVFQLKASWSKCIMFAKWKFFMKWFN